MSYRGSVLGYAVLLSLAEIPSFLGYARGGDPEAFWASYLRFTGLPLAVSRWGDFLLFLLLLAGLFWLYRQGSRALSTSGTALSGVLLAALFLGLLLVPLFPFLSQDLFGYIGEAHLLALGHNPMITPVAAVRGWSADPIFRLAGWQSTVAPYGPLWFGVTALLGRLAGASLLVNFLAQKLLAALLHTLNTFWLGRAGGLRAAYLYAFNPFILLEVVGQAHNDLLLVSALALGLWAWRTDRRVWAWWALALGVAVKYVSLLWVPFWFLREKKEGRSLGLGLAGGMLLLVLCYLPFWAGLRTFRGLLGQGGLLFHSLPAILSGPLAVWGLGHRSGVVASIVGLLLFAGLYVHLGVRLYRGERLERVLLGSLVGFLALGLGWFEPWYLIWGAVPAALLGTTDPWARRFWQVTLTAEIGRSLLLPWHQNWYLLALAAYLITWSPYWWPTVGRLFDRRAIISG